VVDTTTQWRRESSERSVDKRVETAAGKLGEVLVAEGKITPEQLEEARAAQMSDGRRQLGDVLLSMGYASKTDLARALAKRLRLEFVEITERDVERGAASLVDRRVLRKHGAVPLRVEDGKLVVAMSDPTNFYVLMFEDLGGTLPLPTRVAMGASNILTSIFGVFLYAGMGAAVFGFLRWKKTEPGRKVWGRLSLRLPAKIGAVLQKVALARFARTLGTLSAAGVPILQALEITATSSGNWVIENALLKSRDAIREGIPIYKPLESEPVFPPMVTRMIAVGEETGDVDGMLGKIADFYESEVDATVKALTSIIEPLMIVVVGGIVGGIIIAMYLPMFKIFELIE
jgi:Type II secretion system (T2SS), protein F/Type II secretion system (T2SS), protein E, N-terminal domain